MIFNIEKPKQPKSVSRTGAINITVADNTEYTFTGVTNLNMTGANVACMGTIVFASGTPSVTVGGFTNVDGEDITTAEGGEKWEFNCWRGMIIFAKKKA